MPRCKALARGGSRQCRRNALKGQVFCSVHGVKPRVESNRSNAAHSVRTASLRPSSITSSASYSGSLNESQKSRRVLNPAFKRIGISNPLVQHIISDKIGDLSRTWNVGVAANVATMPMLYGGGPGLAAKVVTSVGITFVVGSYLNTMDQYRDLYQFATTGKIHGHSVIGESHS